MIERIITYSLHQRLLVLAIVFLISGIGVWAFNSIPIDAFPDLTNNQVNVITEVPGMAPAEVEQLVTYPLESALMGLPNTEIVRSISKFGLSTITVVFSDGVDVYFARQRVNERLQEAADRIPAGLQPSMGPVATAFGEVYQYVIEGEGWSAMDLKTLHDWTIKQQLRTVPGVNEVNSWGGFIKQYHVLVRPERLQAYGVTLAEVYRVLEGSNTNFSGAFIEHGFEAYTVRGLGLFRSEEDILKTVIKHNAGVPVYVGDVAHVEIGPAIRPGAVTMNGKGEVVSGMAIMTKGENSKNVIEHIKQRVAEIEKTLPPGVRIIPFYDQTPLIERTTETIAENLIMGAVLVIVVLFLFLHEVPAALVLTSIIPLSMLIAFIGMRVFGLSANLMSLGAIDFGLIVDGAVVMMENFVRRLEHHSHGKPVQEQIRISAIEVARPILFGILIIMAVYIPIFALEGMSARMFVPMAITVCMAILGALILTLTYVPVVASLVCRPPKGHKEERIVNALRSRYQSWLSNAIRWRWVTLSVSLVIVLVTLVAASRLGTEFMPQLDEGALLIQTRKLPSVSLTGSAEVSTKVEKAVLEFPEVNHVVTKIGRPDLATEAMGIYEGDVYVLLKPHQEWRFGTKEELIEALDKRLQRIPGVTYNYTQPLAMRMDEMISGVRSDVAVKLFGDDFDQLEQTAAHIRQVLAHVPGSADVQIETLGGAREVRIDLDRSEIGRYGLLVNDVAQMVEIAVGGKVATMVIDGRMRFEVVVRMPKEYRDNVQALQALIVTAPSGERVPLGKLARISMGEAPEVINRENAQRRIVIQSNVRGRDIGSFVAEAQRAIDSKVQLPAGYYIRWGGEFEDQQRATARLMIVLPLSVLIIFLLLFGSFNSVTHASLIMVNLPFALVGGVAAIWIRGLNLSLSASIGFIALFGVAVLNGVVMLSYINRLREEGQGLRRAVLKGASLRLRPVLMTALVASLGFVPMAISTAPGAEVQRPLATVVIGGLITSTLLTLFVLPTLYEWVEQVRLRMAERAARRELRAEAAEYTAGD